MDAVCVVYMSAMVRLALEGDPIGYYNCGNRQGRGGEEDEQRSAKDDASRQHPSVIVYACHLDVGARPRTSDISRVLD